MLLLLLLLSYSLHSPALEGMIGLLTEAWSSLTTQFLKAVLATALMLLLRGSYGDYPARTMHLYHALNTAL